MADVNIRIPRDLIADVDAVHDAMRAMPRYQAMGLSRSAVIRMALGIGLEQLKGELAPKKGRRAKS